MNHHRRRRSCGEREARCRHPRSLFGRLMLIWLLGLAVVLAVSSWIYMGERGRAARNTMFEHMALDVVTVVALMDSLPANERAAALKRLERSHYRFVLATLPEGQQGLHLAASPEGPYYAITFTGGSPA